MFGRRARTYKYIDLPLVELRVVVLRQGHEGRQDGRAVDVQRLQLQRTQMLSLGVVDEQYAKPGTELTLIWGEENGGTKKTTVERHKQMEMRVDRGPDALRAQARETYHKGWRTRRAEVPLTRGYRGNLGRRGNVRAGFLLRVARGRDQSAEREIVRLGVPIASSPSSPCAALSASTMRSGPTLPISALAAPDIRPRNDALTPQRLA